MKLYSRKQKWKIALLIVALLLVGVSLYVSNRIVDKVSQQERSRVTQWADAIKKRAELVRLTNNSFEELRKKELNEMELWIDATKEISEMSPLNSDRSYDLALKIINRNNKIPVIVLDQDKGVSAYINLGFTEEDFLKKFTGVDSLERTRIFDDSLVKLAKSWEQINPSFTIEVYEGLFMSYYYNDSKNIIKLEKERDSLINAFNNELIENPQLVPVILTDSSKTKIIATNLHSEEVDSDHYPISLSKLESANRPIEINFSENEKMFVFYANSPELVQLQYFPYIQFLLIGLLILISYIIFSTFRKAEQNQVWAGMAKETAHQLGTPISSLMAWVQLLEAKEGMQDIAKEMDKDVLRLSQVTDRFSKIGAETQLENANIIETIQQSLSYLRTRLPKKVLLFYSSEEKEINIAHNQALFSWVIENLIKNSVDAMEGEGKIEVKVSHNSYDVFIDISDTGRGMTPSQQRDVFKPGFTTKKRGWGLGMPLAKRIIQEYHQGKIKVLHSEVGKGTTFRIMLNL